MSPPVLIDQLMALAIFPTALEGSVNATQLTATAAVAALQFASCD